MAQHTQNTVIGAKVAGSTGLGSSGGGFGFDGDTSAGGSTTITVPSNTFRALAGDDARDGGDTVNAWAQIELTWSTTQLSYVVQDGGSTVESYALLDSTTTYSSNDDYCIEDCNIYIYDQDGTSGSRFYISTFDSSGTQTQNSAAASTSPVTLTNASSSTISNIQARWVASNANWSAGETGTAYSTSGTAVTSYVLQSGSGSFTDSYVTIKPSVFGGSASNTQFFRFGVTANGDSSSDTALATLNSGGYYRLEILVTRSDSTTQTLIFNKPYIASNNPYIYTRSQDDDPSD